VRFPKSTPKRAKKSRRKTVFRFLLALLLFALISLIYAYKIEPNWIEVNSVQITLPRLPREFQNYRIAQLTDIHVDNWMTEQRLKHIVQLTNRQKPDLVALTGDFVTKDPNPAAPTLVKGLTELKPKDFSVAVLGNHDHWYNQPDVVRQALSDAGVVNLRNEVQTIRRGDAILQIAGVDDYWERKDDLEAVLEQLDEKLAAILLVHEPDYADVSSPTGRFDLELSGHSHGGQVRLPFFGPLKLPNYANKYPTGQYQVGKMVQYTSRGVGMVRPRVRFNCRPELTIITLKTSTQKPAT
jgi:uncharacterized protein